MRYGKYVTGYDFASNVHGGKVRNLTGEEFYSMIFQQIEKDEKNGIYTREQVSMEVGQYIAEIKWMERNCSSIFVESVELIKMLMESKINYDEDKFKVPLGGIVSFLLPAEIEIENLSRIGILIQEASMESDLRSVSKIFNRNVGNVIDLRRNMRVLYNNGQLEKEATTIYDSAKGYYINYLNDKETKKINKIQRLAGALCYYISAFPECLRQGYPDDMKINKKDETEKYVRTLTLPKQIKNSITPGGKMPHLRIGHFRSLKSMRYRRDEKGSVRMIYVKPCAVKGRITPYTATKTKRV